MSDFMCSTRGKVLIADDNEDIRSVMAQVIECEGWQVTEACSGQEALEKVVKDRPDILVLDYRMPGMTGGQVYRVIRSIGINIPVVLITADHRGEQLADSLGIRYFLAKPFDCNTLLSLMDRACAR